MKKSLLFSISLILLIGLFSLFSKNKEKQPNPDVIVTVAPYKYFVERLTNQTLIVKSLVPEAADPHGFSPAAKELIALSSAKAWFSTQEPFEERLQTILKDSNPNLKVSDLTVGFSKCHSSCSHHHHHHEDDLHLWMSPQILQKQVLQIARTLEAIYPEKASIIQTNLSKINADFQNLQQRFETMFSNTHGFPLIVSHPAFGYFCKDYHLKQISLEDETQDSSPSQITKLHEVIKESGSTTLFVQKQHSYKLAQIISKSLDLKMVDFNPYSADYFNNMHQFADHLEELTCLN